MSTILEKRIIKLEKYIKESMESSVKEELYDTLSSWGLSRGSLLKFRRGLMTGNVNSYLVDFVNEIKDNDGVAFTYYSNEIDDDEYGLLDCEDFIEDVIDVIDRCLNEL